MPRGRPRKNRDTAPGGVPIIILQEGGTPNAQPAKQRRNGGGGRSVSRRGKPVRAKIGKRTVSFYPKEFGIQVAASVAEAGIALASAGADLAASHTETNVDDTVLNVGKPIFGTGLRYLAGKMAQKHPGLAYVLSSAGSALNGDYWGNKSRRFLTTAIDTAVKRGK